MEYELAPESIEAKRKEPYWLGVGTGLLIALALWVCFG